MMCSGADQLTEEEEQELVRELETQMELGSPKPTPDKSRPICATPGPVKRFESFGATPARDVSMTPGPTPGPTPVKLLEFDQPSDEWSSWSSWTQADSSWTQHADSTWTQAEADDSQCWGSSTAWVPRTWSTCSWAEEWGYQKPWLVHNTIGLVIAFSIWGLSTSFTHI